MEAKLHTFAQVLALTSFPMEYTIDDNPNTLPITGSDNGKYYIPLTKEAPSDD